ncbi:MAG: winged helix-turn-helix domain-containing protein [Streptosporangiaceae bacterium]|jgi:DNA-binding transcriptional ArsR family regulator
MNPDEPVTLDDPQQMRALAHPARIAILKHLALEGPATATECAQIAGLSPSACSYHLRSLAKYGFVEEDREAAGDGRERPWRAKVRQLKVDTGPDTPPAVRAAGQMLVNTFRLSVDEIRAVYEDREADYPEDWSFGSYYLDIYVTPEEQVELREQVTKLITAYTRADKNDRPADSRRVMVNAEFLPTFSPEEAQ